ncbi:hypothetical protein CF319_g6425 [Tilletia indica]|uniref:RRM domain-containing protein n=1 Tax=Tilletia indica TaxID=43049 RepID=A0A8T8SES5_9BASI|nr:hypothetical protein CF319_g6425 [Tilletia indica]KAE8238644.1 hypothetical protein A4X13_0g8434 [Tilletia indica]
MSSTTHPTAQHRQQEEKKAHHGGNDWRARSPADQGWSRRAARFPGTGSSYRHDPRLPAGQGPPLLQWGAPSVSSSTRRKDGYGISSSQLDHAIDHGRAVRVDGFTTDTLPFHLANIFRAYGHVAGIDMPLSANQQNRGIATIVFESAREASKAVSHMHTGLIDGQAVHLHIE